MKFLSETFIVFFLFVVHFGRADEDPYDSSRAKCRSQLDLTEDEVQDGAFKPTPELGCYLNCVMQDINIVSADGVFSPDELLIKMDQDLREDAKPTVYGCYEETKDIDNLCETAFEFFECFRRNNPEIYAKMVIYR